jgi:PAS domain-containing protein
LKPGRAEIIKKEWERVLDSVGDMVVLSDIGGKINRCNRAFTDFVGRPYNQILGKYLGSLLKEQGIEISDFDVQTLNGYFKAKGKWFGLKSHPFKDIVTGDITGAVIHIHDESIPPTPVEFREDGN